MTAERLPDEPFVEQRRLERAINIARWLGAVIAFVLGPLFPNLGIGHVAALGGVLVACALGIRWLSERAATPAAHLRVFRIAFALDLAVVIYAVFIFSNDPGWTTYIVGVLVVITGGFRFGTAGALIAAGVFSVAYVFTAAFRELVFDLGFETHRVVFHVAIYFLAALLIARILDELHFLRAERDRFLRQASEAEALREADRLKREFISSISHDFRTPLTVVRGAIELLLGERPGALTHGQRELAESAARNVRRLEEFTEELLEVARLEEGKVALTLETVDPATLLAEVIGDHKVLAAQKGQRIALSLNGAPESIRADRLRLRQIVANLVANAIRYAPNGTEIEVRGEQADGALRVSVRDHGPGISPDERARMFDTFFRGRSAAGTVGSGLGLAIARSLVALHRGTLAYEDTPGGGATFVVTIPVGAG